MINVKQKLEAKKPSIELVNHFFTKINIEANSKVSPDVMFSEDPLNLSFEIDVDIKAFAQEGEEDVYGVSLDIKADEPDESAAWLIDVSLTGYFRFTEDVDEGIKGNIVYVNGQSMLYGIAREMIYSLTMRGPFDPVYLPTLSLIHI